jgi:hypothetical protein
MIDPRRCATRTILTLILLLSTPLAAQTRPADAVLADFEAGGAAALTAANLIATIDADAAPQGRRYLHLTTGEARAGAVRLPPLDAGAFVGRDHLSAMLRAPQAEKQVALRWLAQDEKGETLFQRRFELPAGGAWVRIDEPLEAWRWGDDQAGDWDEVKRLALRIETPAVRVDLDDVRLSGTLDEKSRIAHLLALAYERRDRRMVTDEELLVATDAVDAFQDADLKRLLLDMQAIRAMLGRVFGQAVRPIDDAAPACLLIFRSDDDESAFLERLGKSWRAAIAPPGSQGYTVQDIASSTYRAELGVRRPVYLHEATHAIVAHDLRLLTGNDAHTPLQEGLANYVQLCFFPQSLDAKTYPANFGKPVDRSGKGFFKPLETLFARRATTRDYAQLASVIAYLIDADQPLLRDLAAGVAHGVSAGDVLRRRGADWQALEDAWYAWGRARFAGKTQAPDAPPFERFPEMK